MTIQKLANQLAKIEGKKHEASVGDIREILRALCALEAAHRVNNDKRLTNAEPFDALELDVQKKMKLVRPQAAKPRVK